MDDAELYAVHNSLQRQGTAAAILAHGGRMRWAQDGHERALDIGCGPGDVTCELLLPVLPPESTIIGIDVSPKMVEYASAKNRTKNVHFKTVDFGMKDITNVFQEQSFSKIFSFYCLHWIRDQRQVARNIYTLLRPTGEFLLVTAPSNQVYRVYRALAESDQWKPYMHDVDRFIPSGGGGGGDEGDACAEFRRNLESAGLEVAACYVRADEITFPSMRALIRANQAVNPFAHRMPASERDHYWACFERICVEQRLCRPLPSGEVQTDNHTVVAYGRRPTARHHNGQD